MSTTPRVPYVEMDAMVAEVVAVRAERDAARAAAEAAQIRLVDLESRHARAAFVARRACYGRVVLASETRAQLEANTLSAMQRRRASNGY